MMTKKEVLSELERMADGKNWARKESVEALQRAIDMIEDYEYDITETD